MTVIESWRKVWYVASPEDTIFLVMRMIEGHTIYAMFGFPFSCFEWKFFLL